MVYRNCQICNGPSSIAFSIRNYDILKCNDCNHYYTDLAISPENIQEIYSDNYFNGGGAGYPDYLIEKEILLRQGEYYARKIRKFINPGKVLDVGSAAGFILKGFENMGWKGTGIEPNETMVEYGTKNLELDLYHDTLETFKPDSKFHLVIMIQVIAHLSDVNLSISKISDLLEPGGFLLVETWNRSSITARLFGKHWHEYSPPSTMNFFNKKTLDQLMKKYNFNKISSGRPQKKILSNHGKSLFRHKMDGIRFLREFSGIINIIPDNIVLSYPSEDLFWSLYQKSNS
jgi:SAM-dependent methyltransferase